MLRDSRDEPVRPLKLESCRTQLWLTFNIRSLLGGDLAGQKKFAEAEPLLVSGYDGLKQREEKITAANKARVKEALERLVQAYTGWGRPAEAAGWQRKLDELNSAAANAPAGADRK
ncbi:MAG: hypothetical protein EXS37_07595 [Opitutus sp.]|nr:hypothetical protein [Opitutus sp.]